MKKLILTTLLSVFTVTLAFNQDTSFVKRYENQLDFHLLGGIPNPEDGFFASGNISNNGLVMSADSLGNVLWSNSLNFNNGSIIFYEMFNTLDSGFVSLGRMQYSNNDNRLICAKYNTVGDTLWTKSFYFPSEINQSEFVPVGAEKPDSSMVITWCNDITKRAYLISLDKNGNLLWDKIILNNGLSNTSVATDDHAIYLTGVNDTISSLIKFDNSGNELWSKSFESLLSKDITLINDMLYIHYTRTPYTTNQLMSSRVAKFDTTGNLIWYYRYPITHFSSFPSYFGLSRGPIIQAVNDSVLAITVESLFPSNIVFFDSSGYLISHARSNSSQASIIPHKYGKAYLIGNGALFSIKSSEWYHAGVNKIDDFIAANECFSSYTNIIQSIDSFITVSQSFTYSTGLQEYSESLTTSMVSLSTTDDCIKQFTDLPENLKSSFSVYPNPSTGKFKLEINDLNNYSVQVFTIDGRMVKTVDFTGDEFTLDLTDQLPGQYLFKLFSENTFYSGKLIVE